MPSWDIFGTLAAAQVASAYPLWAAVIAGVVAIVLSAVGRKREHDDRRKTLYSQAFEAVLAWEEALYRVRRRASDGSEDATIKNGFHDLQERIAYHYGWLSIESAELGTSYMALADTVKRECAPLIQEAWAQRPRELALPVPTDEAHPNLQDAKATFLREVRKTFAGPLKNI